MNYLDAINYFITQACAKAGGPVNTRFLTGLLALKELFHSSTLRLKEDAV